MTQFKVGDRVKLIRDGGAWCRSNIGKEGVITPRQGKDYSYVDVIFDNSGGETWEHDYGNPDHLELVHTITTPPATIQHEGYNYTRGEPVVPEWVKDGAWVVEKETGDVMCLSVSKHAAKAININGHIKWYGSAPKNVPSVFRPFTNKDWKWGMWAEYKGEKVFVMNRVSEKGVIEFSKSPRSNTGLSGWAVDFACELTPTTAP